MFSDRIELHSSDIRLILEILCCVLRLSTPSTSMLRVASVNTINWFFSRFHASLVKGINWSIAALANFLGIGKVYLDVPVVFLAAIELQCFLCTLLDDECDEHNASLLARFHILRPLDVVDTPTHFEIPAQHVPIHWEVIHWSQRTHVAWVPFNLLNVLWRSRLNNIIVGFMMFCCADFRLLVEIMFRDPRVSTTPSRLISGYQWSPTCFLIHFGRLTAITLNRWLNSTRREKNHFLCSRHQGHSYDLGCNAGKPHRKLLEHRLIKRFVRLMDRLLEKHNVLYENQTVSTTTSKLISWLRWKKTWFLVNFVRLHWPSSRLIESQI